MRALDRLKGLLKSERGNVLAIGAATMPLLIGSAALAVDTIHLSVVKRQLQRAADSAALAGAYALVQDKPVASSVSADLAYNNSVTLTGSPTVENAPTTGSFAGNTRAVRVVLNSSQSTPFMGFFNQKTTTVRTEATAAVIYNGKFCMVSLEKGNIIGITFAGNTTLDLGCGVATNSKSQSAVYAYGSSSIKASPIAAVGNVPASASYASGTVRLPYSPQQADPYASLPRTPTPPSDCVNLDLNPNGNGTVVFPPLGTSKSYCLKSTKASGQNPAKISSNITLPSATYYVQGGTLDIGPATVSGTGVTFVLTTGGQVAGVANVTMNANAVLNLTAPTSGTYKGVLMYQDSNATGGTNTINGNSGSTLEGGFYFPKSDLVFNGNSTMKITCLQLVALHLTFSGNSKMTNECPTNSGANAFDAIWVRLVG